jgi:hypothetical protein
MKKMLHHQFQLHQNQLVKIFHRMIFFFPLRKKVYTDAVITYCCNLGFGDACKISNILNSYLFLFLEKVFVQL